MSTYDQMMLQAQMRPEDAVGFGPGTPQYAAYRANIDRGQAMANEMDPAWMGKHPFAAGGPGWAAAVNMGGAVAGGGLGGGLSDISVPSAGDYLPAQSLSSQAAPTLGMTVPGDVTSVGTGSAGGTGFLQNLRHLFNMGGNNQQRAPQNQIVPDEQQAAQILADALRKRETPSNSLVPGGPVTVRY